MPTTDSPGGFTEGVLSEGERGVLTPMQQQDEHHEAPQRRVCDYGRHHTSVETKPAIQRP